jgi:large subunit ribosomal protein L2
VHKGKINGKIIDFICCPGHSAPLMKIEYEDGKTVLLPAPEGVRINDPVESGATKKIRPGNTLPLKAIPEGTTIYNIEFQPGDGGKFVRSSGAFAKIVSKTGNFVTIRLPSKREKTFNAECRACIGIVAGGGRKEKPLLKAGNVMRAKRARNKLYPIVSPNSMSAISHPYGNTRSLRKSKAKPVSRNAPPGRKVGMIAAKRTGRRKK